MKLSHSLAQHSGLVEEALAQFAGEGVMWTSLESYESAVYAWERRGCRSVLKLSRKDRRTREQILGEIDFVHYVSEHGVAVARPIATKSGEYVIGVGDTAGYWAYASEWAKGETIGPGDDGPELYSAWGAAMGQLHRLASLYVPKRPEWRRPDWEASELTAVTEGLSLMVPELRAAASSWIDKLTQIPRRKEAFGLIHNDLHPRNFHRSGDGVTLFDFDGLTYHHYASDIAVSLYYALADHSRADENDWSQERFLYHFLQGYAVHRPVTAELQCHIPDWMMLRHIQLYVSYVRAWGERPSEIKERWTLSRYKKDITEGTLFGRKP